MDAGDWRDINFVEIPERRVALLHAFRKKFRERGVRDGENVGVGGFFAAVIEADAGDFAVFDFQAADRCAQDHFPARASISDLQPSYKFAERDRGNAHAVAGAVRKKGFPENIDAEARVGAIEFFIESADEDDAPEALDGALCLAAAAEPFEHGDAAGFVEVGGLPLCAQEYRAWRARWRVCPRASSGANVRNEPVM